MRVEMLAACLLVAACGREPAQRLEGDAMGMRWGVRLTEGQAERAEIEEVFERWERAASLWREDSELARFNRAPANQWVCLGPELWKAASLARKIAGETGEALDITVGPLARLWGFGTPFWRNAPPSGEKIEEALRCCGWRHLEWDEERRAVRKLREGVEVNVNAVVEGLALEDLAETLRVRGHGDFLLELGGEVLAAGGPWAVAVQAPGKAPGEEYVMLPLEDGALATSGTYRQHFEHGGREYSHVIDPRTGRPVTHRLGSVSVAHPNCGLADGYATALLVLGPEEGRRVAERLGLRVFWIEEVGNGK